MSISNLGRCLMWNLCYDTTNKIFEKDNVLTAESLAAFGYLLKHEAKKLECEIDKGDGSISPRSRLKLLTLSGFIE